MNRVVGLTGGIGCGKSTVANLFAKHGAGVIDTDAISHHLTRSGGEALSIIRAAFGSDYITADGALDRVKMRSRIFSDNAAKLLLEQILHPLILEQARMQMQRLQACPYIIVVVPLLPESASFRQLVQRVLVVDCDEGKQIERVAKRSGMTAAEARIIIARQTSRAARLQFADDVIHNDGSLESLAGQVAVLHERYAGLQNDI